MITYLTPKLLSYYLQILVFIFEQGYAKRRYKSIFPVKNQSSERFMTWKGPELLAIQYYSIFKPKRKISSIYN